MGKLCECDEVPLEQYAVVAAERDSLRKALKSAAKTIRELLELHNPKEAAAHEHQLTAREAAALVADFERLVLPTAPAKR